MNQALFVTCRCKTYADGDSLVSGNMHANKSHCWALTHTSCYVEQSAAQGVELCCSTQEVSGVSASAPTCFHLFSLDIRLQRKPSCANMCTHRTACSTFAMILSQEPKRSPLQILHNFMVIINEPQPQEKKETTEHLLGCSKDATAHYVDLQLPLPSRPPPALPRRAQGRPARCKQPIGLSRCPFGLSPCKWNRFPQRSGPKSSHFAG